MQANPGKQANSYHWPFDKKSSPQLLMLLLTITPHYVTESTLPRGLVNLLQLRSSDLSGQSYFWSHSGTQEFVGTHGFSSGRQGQGEPLHLNELFSHVLDTT